MQSIPISLGTQRKNVPTLEEGGICESEPRKSDAWGILKNEINLKTRITLVSWHHMVYC